VPHDQPGSACASLGFVPSGVALDPVLNEFALIIRSSDELDATALDVKKTYVGNVKGVAIPNRSMEIDNNADGLTDLAVFYSAKALSVLQDQGPIGLHYRSTEKVDYLVPDIFCLGEPVPLVPVIELPRRQSGAGEGDDGAGAPSVTALRSAYPNPFNPSTTIPFSLVGQEPVSLQIYDAQGKLVRTLRNDVMPAGQQEAVWDGRDNSGNQMATGVYFVRFVAGSYEMTRKVVMLK
ncbi:MAG: FlgD immunoglobulin-like domain containing protein, partial [bacterium]